MRFEIYKSRTMRGTPPLSIRPQRWRFRLVADNNKILAYSEAYTNKDDVVDAIESIVAAIGGDFATDGGIPIVMKD